MTYAPDPTYLDPGLGWTEQNKHRTSAEPATAGTQQPEQAASSDKPAASPRRGRRPKQAS